MKSIKEILKKILYRHTYDSESYYKFLKKQGFKIGEDVTFYCPRTITLDFTRPWMIEIGSHVRITKGCTIITHGYDWSVLKTKYGNIYGSCGKVKIGDNVFIGIESIILKGVTIGNNVIIGARSLVNKDIPDNVVVAGNPARVICTIDEYKKKRSEKQLVEAVECATTFYETYGFWPSKKDMREFIFLFESRKDNLENNEVFNEIGNLCCNFEYTKKVFLSKKGMFNSFDDFINYCKKQIGEKSE